MRKVAETIKFQPLGSFETVGSKLSHGTSKKFADVRPHLRKVFKITLSLSSIHPMVGFYLVVKRRVVKPRIAKIPQARGRLQIARLEKRAVPSGMAKLTISPKKLEVDANFSAGNLLIKRLETFGLIFATR